MIITLNHSELYQLSKMYISGVYILYLGTKIIYIGRSINVYSRIYNHLRDKKFDTYAIIPTTERISYAIEQILIALLEPLENKVIDTSERNLSAIDRNMTLEELDRCKKELIKITFY